MIKILRKRWHLLLLVLILAFSAFFRLFRLDSLLGFWYDQGRDALIIWDLIHHGKLFLIGPVTGIEGIFLGPFYYYLLAPFYLIGAGNPAFAAAGLSLLTVGAIFLIYLLAKEIYGKEVGLIAAFLYGFSFNLVVFSRWLANPNPLPFFTMLLLFFLYQFIRGKERSLIPVGFLLGLCLQLEAASAIFFLPATMVILVWQKKKINNFWVLVASFLLFFITLLPQIYFNCRHDGILVAAFEKFLVADKSFGLSLFETAKLRVMTYYDVFFGKLIPGGNNLKLLCLALFSATAVFFRKSIFNKTGKFLAAWLIVPIVGFLFYRGNHGYVWDYYFTGVIPAFVILFSAGLFMFAKKSLIGKFIIGAFLILFLGINMKTINTYFKTGIGITLRSQEKAIDWIYNDAGSEDFNVDVYVPPQIYFSYSYLFRWYGKSKYGREPNTNLVKDLYTLYEPDGEHPQFLKAWLERQDTIGKIVKNYSWGDITVNKRERIEFDD